MKIKTTILTLAMLFLAFAPLMATDAQDKEYAELVKNQTAILEPVLALGARDWAYQIAVLRNGTYEEFAENSKNWAYTEEYKAKYLKALKHNLETKNYKPLSRAERKTLNDAYLELRKYNFPAEFDTEIVEYLDNAECLDIDARYWAFRVQRGDFSFDVLKQRSDNWGWAKERTKAVMAKMEELVKKGEPVVVKSYERYVMHACGKKFGDLPPPGPNKENASKKDK